MINKLIQNLDTCGNKLSRAVGFEDNMQGAASCYDNASELVTNLTEGAKSLADYLSYRYFDEENKVFINDKEGVGFVLRISGVVGVDDNLIKNLRYFFNDEMPASSWLQFLLVASHNVMPVLSRWQASKTNHHEALSKITNKRVEFISSLANNFADFDGRIARDYQIYLSFTQKLNTKGRLEQSSINKITGFRDRLSKKLDTLKVNSAVLDAGELIYLVREIMQMEALDNGFIESDITRRNKYDKFNILSHQALNPLKKLKVEEDSLYSEDSGLVSKSYYIKELPREFSLEQMICLLGSSDNNLLSIPARFVISYVVANNLTKGASDAFTTKGNKVIEAAEQWYSRNDRDLKREALEWKDILDRYKNGEKFLEESFSVMITAPKGASIEQAEQALLSLYNTLDFRIEVNKHLQLPAVLSMLPMQQIIYWNFLKLFKLTRVCLSNETIARLPIHAEWKGVPEPGMLLFGRRGQIFNWNPFYRISSGNYNVSLFGPSGGGKSVFLQELVVNMVSKEVKCFVLDIGKSFANVCKLLDGEIIEFGKNKGLSLNPFASFKQLHNPDDRGELLICSKALMEVMCGVKRDDPHLSAELEKAIDAALVLHDNDLDIDKFAAFLELSDELLLKRFGSTLYPYTAKGSYGKYFSGTKSPTFKECMTVFEFEEIKNDPKLLSIVLQILLIEVTNQFLTGDRSKRFMIIVDEAWMLLDFAAPFFAAFGRTVRKYGGSLVICVQNFTDFAKTGDHRVILENSTWTIILKQNENGLSSFKESEAFKDILPLIQSVSFVPGKYSEVLIYTTGVRVIGRLMLDNYSKTLYSTDNSDFTYIKNSAEAGISLDETIENLSQMKYGNNL